MDNTTLRIMIDTISISETKQHIENKKTFLIFFIRPKTELLLKCYFK